MRMIVQTKVHARNNVLSKLTRKLSDIVDDMGKTTAKTKVDVNIPHASATSTC